jgi:hypothetical protein
MNDFVAKEYHIINKMHMDFLNELLRKATLDLDIDASKNIKVERDMLQLQLK